MTPILSLLLVHDHLFAKRGIAASSTHPLRQAIERHKARLQAEFTKARLRRKCANIEDLKKHLLSQNPSQSRSQPRWIRVNTLKSSVAAETRDLFEGYRTDATISEVVESPLESKILGVDTNIPNVLAVPPDTELTKTQSYREGNIILQDKASCFPAYLLVGNTNERSMIGDCIDGCAAPGNKTSHLAALLDGMGNKIYACERDPKRSRTLSTMMERSGAEKVTVLARCDFLTLDPRDARFQNVTHLLLDPSCSGSGIVGREDIPSLALPVDPRAQRSRTRTNPPEMKSKKRKLDDHEATSEAVDESLQLEETKEIAPDKTRLQKLSALQARIVEHALSFPAAIRITYSTCSVHEEENEMVVARILESEIAKARGWRVLRREDQVDGLRRWNHRGVLSSNLTEEQREACIRCQPGDEEGTMGFFLCGFVRSTDGALGAAASDDGWEGFND